MNSINEYRKKYPDIDDWEVYTEQPSLIAPINNISFEEYLNSNNPDKSEDYNDIENSYTIIKALEKELDRGFQDLEKRSERRKARDSRLDNDAPSQRSFSLLIAVYGQLCSIYRY